MEQIGYSLIDSADAEVQKYGDTIGQCPDVPNPIVLPNGDIVHAATVGGQYQDWRLVLRMVINDQPSPQHAEIDRTIQFDGTQTIVTIIYEDEPSIPPPPLAPATAVLLDHENRLRAIEGEPVITPHEFIRMRGL